MKCVAIDKELHVVTSETIEFVIDLPYYTTQNGVYINDDVVDCPVLMWVEALDLLLLKLKDRKFPFEQVVGISGSCQQHGSVYWSYNANKSLERLNGNDGSLMQELREANAFSRYTAPNWQDHSTAKQCKEMEDAIGGPEMMSKITGSRAHLRFTGPQILKIVETERETYKNTGTITLVSNFLASLFCGKLVPLDEADSCGMNLYDIRKRKFNVDLLNIIDNKANEKTILKKLLGEPIKSDTTARLGNISQYFVKKYGFNESCSIYSFTGDNLATICSLPLCANDVLISLGTSTTVLVVTDIYHPSKNYHTFIHPTIPNHFMTMICYSNGSLAREKVRDNLNKQMGLNDSQTWALFNNAVLDDKLNTNSELGVYFPINEIVPSVSSVIKRVQFNSETGQIPTAG